MFNMAHSILVIDTGHWPRAQLKRQQKGKHAASSTVVSGTWAVTKQVTPPETAIPRPLRGSSTAHVDVAFLASHTALLPPSSAAQRRDLLAGVQEERQRIFPMGEELKNGGIFENSPTNKLPHSWSL